MAAQKARSKPNRELLVLRHGKSAWDTDAETDFDRPLAPRGKRDAPKIGLWLKERELVPDYLVSSPAERASQTVLRVGKELGMEKEQIHWDSRIYGASISALLAVLAECPRQADRVMLVGHNPGLEELVLFLGAATVQIPGDGKLMPTAALARLELPADWSGLAPGSARLLSITRPRMLPG